MGHVLTKYQNTIPSIYKPETNKVILALLTALSVSDEFLVTQANNAKDQLFVRTATGQGLDRIGASLGVLKPISLGLLDTTFQELIPILSLRPKQIKKSFYSVADVFWGAKFTRTNLTSLNFANLNLSGSFGQGPFGSGKFGFGSPTTFNLVLGDLFKISVDNGATQTLKVVAGDVLVNGKATSAEVKTWLSQIKGATVDVEVDPTNDNEFINIRSNTIGQNGSLEFFASSAIGTLKLDFPLGPVDISDLSQRFVVYNVRPNELLIEIPAIVPVLTKTLTGSHHFHTTNVIEPQQPPNNKVWQGSFIYDPSGSSGQFSITGQTTTLITAIAKDSSLTIIEVADSAKFLSPTGNLVFDFGKATQESGIPYTSILNSTSVTIDPNFIFTKNHLVGSNINVISAKTPIVPRSSGNDFGIYLDSPASLRVEVQSILEKLKAAGIVLKFVVLGPTYKYLISSPF